MGFFVIGDEDTVLGFRHAGVQGRVVQDSKEAAEVLDDVFQAGDQSIIIITEKLAESIRSHITDLRFGTALPLIVEIPGPEGPSEASPDLMEMIRDAVGIKF
jgi:V/A-type H+-transporting ATPase subunit F